MSVATFTIKCRINLLGIGYFCTMIFDVARRYLYQHTSMIHIRIASGLRNHRLLFQSIVDHTLFNVCSLFRCPCLLLKDMGERQAKSCGEAGHQLERRFLIKSGRRDSNPLPTAWEAVALPGELLPLFTNRKLQ